MPCSGSGSPDTPLNRPTTMREIPFGEPPLIFRARAAAAGNPPAGELHFIRRNKSRGATATASPSFPSLRIACQTAASILVNANDKVTPACIQTALVDDRRARR